MSSEQLATHSMKAISLILITYNREADIRKTLETLRAFSADVREIVVINNASTDGTAKVLAEAQPWLPNLKIILADANLGVAGGRNLGIRHASGEILVFLDDDAEILTPDFALKVEARFREEPSLGAMAFKVVNGEGIVRLNEFPHWNKRLPRDREFRSAYFVGAGHAIRAEALRKTGLYPEEFFYSQEELYLCYALVNHGYSIVYFPAVTVLHWQSGAGRTAINNRKWYLLLRNTLLVNHRFMPWPVLLLSIPVWSLKAMILARGPGTVLAGLRDFNRMRREPLFTRAPFSTSAFAYVRRNGGRVWW